MMIALQLEKKKHWIRFCLALFRRRAAWRPVMILQLGVCYSYPRSYVDLRCLVETMQMEHSLIPANKPTPTEQPRSWAFLLSRASSVTTLVVCHLYLYVTTLPR